MISDLKRPAWIEIDTHALRHNIKAIRSSLADDAKLMIVAKANAYGHDAVRVSRIAQEENVDFIGVAMLEEALELKESGIKTPIVILYPEDLERTIEAANDGFIITVSDLTRIDEIVEKANSSFLPVKYFIKANTGMNRFGARSENIIGTLESIKNNPNAKILGITTNLASPNGNDSELAKIQRDKYEDIVKTFRTISSNGYLLSCASSGSLSSDDFHNGSLYRVGHLVYGLHPNGHEQLDLKPVMSVKSRIAEIQDLDKGDGVGYGFTHITDKKMKIAVIPLGYADGYPWSLSNRGHVLIRGEKANVVGRICMDVFMVDITDITGCQIGDDVIIMGKMGSMEINAHELGMLSGSFSYEILSRWSKRLPRIIL